MQLEVSSPLKKFADQKWRHLLNIAAAETSGFAMMGAAQEVKNLSTEGAEKAAEAKVALADVMTDTKKAPNKCWFADLLNCLGFH
jgi:hypothetical protein